MNDRNRRSAAEVMANAARVVKAAVNIVRAAIAGAVSYTHLTLPTSDLV